jgi:hypothetical protein
LVSIKTGLTLGLIGAGALAFYALGGAKGIGSRIGGGFTGFGQSLADAFKFPEFVVEKSGGIQYDEKVLEGQSYEIPNYLGDKTLIIPSGTVSPEGIFRSDVPPMTKAYAEQFAQSIPNVDLPDTTSTPSNPYPKAPSLAEIFPRLRGDPASQTSTPAPEEPIVFDKPQSQLQLQYDKSIAGKLGLINRPNIKPIGTSITGGEFYGWGSATGGGI